MTGWERVATCGQLCCGELCYAEYGSLPSCIKAHHLIQCSFSIPSSIEYHNCCDCDETDGSGLCESPPTWNKVSTTIPAINGYAKGGYRYVTTSSTAPCFWQDALPCTSSDETSGGHFERLTYWGSDDWCTNCTALPLNNYLTSCGASPLNFYKCSDDTLAFYQSTKVTKVASTCTIEPYGYHSGIGGDAWVFKLYVWMMSQSYTSTDTGGGNTSTECCPVNPTGYAQDTSTFTWYLPADCITEKSLQDSDVIYAGADNTVTVDATDTYYLSGAFGIGDKRFGFCNLRSGSDRQTQTLELEPTVTIQVPNYDTFNWTPISGYGNSMCAYNSSVCGGVDCTTEAYPADCPNTSGCYGH